MPTKKRLIILSSILFLLLAATGVLAYQYFSGGQLNLSVISNLTQKLKPQSTPQPKEPPFSPKPIGTGKQTGRFSHGSQVKGPKPQTVTIDPIDPKPKQVQTITVTIKSESPVSEALLHFHTDHQTVTKKLKLIEGDNTNGTWQVKHKYKDTYDRNYYLQFELTAQNGEKFKGGMRYRP